MSRQAHNNAGTAPAPPYWRRMTYNHCVLARGEHTLLLTESLISKSPWQLQRISEHDNCYYHVDNEDDDYYYYRSFIIIIIHLIHSLIKSLCPYRTKAYYSIQAECKHPMSRYLPFGIKAFHVCSSIHAKAKVSQLSSWVLTTYEPVNAFQSDPCVLKRLR